MATTYLTRTGTATGENKIFTFSAWVKRSGLGNQALVQGNGDPSTLNYVDYIEFNSSNQLRFLIYHNSNLGEYVTNAVYRDTSAWYHVVVSVDTTQLTSSNRVKFYVNGEQITSFATETAPSQNQTLQFNTVDSVYSVGVQYSTGFNQKYFDGEMAHVHYIDGTAYAASTFGETDATTGIWKPKTAPSVTYGTNGFFLKFENSGAMGTDSSGNGNNFSVSGNLTQTIDTPSNVFATMNAIDNSSVTLSNGNLTCSCASPSGIRSTLGVTAGKYYMEVKYQSTTSMCGVVAMEQAVTTQAIGATIFGQSGGSAPELFLNGSAETDYSSAGAFSSNDIMQIALDMDTNTVYFGKNGSWFGGTSWTESTPTTGHTLTSGYTYGVRASTGSGTSVNIWNFGNGYFGTTAVSSAQNPDDGIGIFEYDVPTGYRALCTKSINAEEYS